VDRVSSIAQRALQRLGSPAPSAGGGASLPREVRLGRLDMPQLTRLVYLQAGDPVVDQVLGMLKAGRPVYLDRPAVESALGLADYPPRLQEQFNRWFSRLAGYGIHLTAEVPAPPLPAASLAPRVVVMPAPSLPRPIPVATPVTATVVGRPDQQIFAEILGEAVAEPHPCVKEPGRACCGSGRCKTLGF
jgi:hypothetical protein